MKNETQEEKDDPQLAQTKTSMVRRKPTSVALTPAEIDAVRADAARRNIKCAAVLRDAIRQYIGQHPVANTVPSIGIADGIVHPTIRDDVVELSNILSAVAYAGAALELRITRRHRSHLRLLLQETLQKMKRITGAIE